MIIPSEVILMNISASIIMRIKELGESDLLVTFFTSDKGRLKGIGKGARRSRRRFPNCLDLLSFARMEYERRKNRGLYFLHSCKLIDPFSNLRNDFYLLSLASYMVELTEILFPTEVADKNMFETLKNALIALDNGCKADILRVIFEAKAMALGGYRIALDTCCICGRPYTGKGIAVFKRDKGGIACLRCQQKTPLNPVLDPNSIRTLKLAQSATWSNPAMIILPDEILNEIRTVLKLHIEYRIGRKIKTDKYLS
jgi:DNA repair protein RecO (recombination protein O)